MLFDKQELKDVIDGDSDTLTLILDEITDNGRWTINHRLVFEDNSSNRFYETSYRVGATEYQDETPFEYELDKIDCKEVFKKRVMVAIYE